MSEKDLIIAIVGHYASTSGWASLLHEDGLYFKTYKSTKHIEETPDFTIFLKDSDVTPEDWKYGPAIFDQRYPPQAKVYAPAWAERIFYKTGNDFVAPFRGWAIHWNGPSLGVFTLCPEDGPYYPVACFDGDKTFIVGDISDALISLGTSFRPICTSYQNEVHQIHPASCRNKVKRFLLEVLLIALNTAGLPVVSLSPYPPGQALPFIFRVDVDYIVDPVMAPIRKWASLFDWKISAFVNISGEEAWEDGGAERPPGGCQPIENLRWLPELQNEGHEVACHGFFHTIWPDYKKELTDLIKAKGVLEDLIRQQVVGHAFPGGLWHPVAAMAVKDAGFVYSTEASIAWGGNPFFPVMEASDKYPLQIPCSPLYPSCHELGGNVEERFLDAFLSLARESVAHREPVSFMGHPFDLENATPSLWEGIAEIINSLECQPVTMSYMSRIAQQRETVKLRIFKRNGIWHAATNQPWELLVNNSVMLAASDPKPLSISASKPCDLT